MYMKKEELKKIIKQVIYNPQVSFPPISYKITDVSHTNRESFTSEYIDIMERVLVCRLTVVAGVRKLVCI